MLVAFSRCMQLTTIANKVFPSTLATVSLLTATLGFAGGWIAHRHVALRQLRPYQPPLQRITMTPALRSNDLAIVEARCPGAQLSIVAESPYHYRVDRRALACMMTVPSTRALLSATPRIVPAFCHHQPSGFRLYAIPPGSLAARLGLRNGDTVRTVNSMPVNSEDTLHAAYQRFRTAAQLTVGIERGGQPAMLRYHVFGPPM